MSQTFMAQEIAEIPRSADVFLRKNAPKLDPLLRVVSFYRFIEALARRRGLNSDTPRHLRKITETA